MFIAAVENVCTELQRNAEVFQIDKSHRGSFRTKSIKKNIKIQTNKLSHYHYIEYVFFISLNLSVCAFECVNNYHNRDALYILPNKQAAS